MAKKDTLTAVKEKMQGLLDMRAADLEKIEQTKAAALHRIQAAKAAIEEATTAMNADAYTKAKEEIRQAEALRDMCDARAGQLKRQEYITESERDEVIESLLQYEKELTAALHAKITPMLQELETVNNIYRGTIYDIERTIEKWCADIHANYRQVGYIRTLPDGTTTNRHEKPWPVHMMKYSGSTESNRLHEYLAEILRLLKNG